MHAPRLDPPKYRALRFGDQTCKQHRSAGITGSDPTELYRQTIKSHAVQCSVTSLLSVASQDVFLRCIQGCLQGIPRSRLHASVARANILQSSERFECFLRASFH